MTEFCWSSQHKDEEGRSLDADGLMIDAQRPVLERDVRSEHSAARPERLYENA